MGTAPALGAGRPLSLLLLLACTSSPACACRSDQDCLEPGTVCDGGRCACRHGLLSRRQGCRAYYGGHCVFDEDCAPDVEARVRCVGGRCLCPKPWVARGAGDLPRCLASAALRQDAGVSASHIILMLLGCVLALALCHLAIRLWMRRRESLFLRSRRGSPSRPPPPQLRDTDPVLSGALPGDDPPPDYETLPP